MNLKARHADFPLWAGAQADIDRVTAIWQDSFAVYGGPYLLASAPTMADAMYAPVCTRVLTYDVKLAADCLDYRDTILGMEAMREWIALAESEPDEIEELDIEF